MTPQNSWTSLLPTYFSWGWKLEDAKHTRNTKESDSTPSPTNPAAKATTFQSTLTRVSQGQSCLPGRLHMPPHKSPEAVTTILHIEAGPSIDSVGKRSTAVSRYHVRPTQPMVLAHRLPYRVEGGLGSITNHLNPGFKPSLGGGGVICTTYALCSFYFSRDVLASPAPASGHKFSKPLTWWF